MATIGTFKKTGSNEFTGEIVTLSVQAKGVRIVPDLRATGENAPSHRVLVGRAEIGAAWSKRSNEGRDYLGLKLDDPSFNAPIYANLFDDEEGDSFSSSGPAPTVAAATEARNKGSDRKVGPSRACGKAVRPGDLSGLELLSRSGSGSWFYMGVDPFQHGRGPLRAPAVSTIAHRSAAPFRRRS